MMGYTNKIIKEKESSVVTLQQAKQQLNIEEDFKDDDAHILFLINTATSMAEDFTGIDVAFTKNTQEFVDFIGGSIIFREAPLVHVESITVTDNEGNEIIVPEEEYTIRTRRTDFMIEFENTISYDKVVVVFYTGFDIEEVPYQIQAAVLVKVNDLYDIERTSYIVGSNFKDNRTFERLLSSFVINRW